MHYNHFLQSFGEIQNDLLNFLGKFVNEKEKNCVQEIIGVSEGNRFVKKISGVGDEEVSFI